jgi:hypothetical protein
MGCGYELGWREWMGKANMALLGRGLSTASDGPLDNAFVCSTMLVLVVFCPLCQVFCLSGRYQSLTAIVLTLTGTDRH